MVFGAEYLIYFLILLMFVLAVKGKVREKKSLILALLAIPIAILLIKLIHLAVSTPRPFVSLDIVPLVDHQADESFPSRHAAMAAVLSLPYLYFKSKWSTLFLTLMLWVGIARVYVGVHYPLDIIGGFAVGIISLLAALQIKKLLRLGFFR